MLLQQMSDVLIIDLFNIKLSDGDLQFSDFSVCLGIEKSWFSSNDVVAANEWYEHI